MKSNIILLLCDDLDARIAARFRLVEGATFTNSFTVNPLCCPSRASLLTGQYTHNHRVYGNAPPIGGVEKYRDEGHEARDIAVSMREAGYLTAYIGKYLNHYDGSYIPEGWERWQGFVGGYAQTPYRFNENGEIVSYDPDRYHDTYLMRDKAIRLIRRLSLESFFMVVSLNAPHSPSPPAPEDKTAYQGEQAPREGAYNEEDISDKPRYLRNLVPLTSEEKQLADAQWRKKLRSMKSVERSIDDITSTLEEVGILENTYLVFTSDNGYHFGEHGLETGKNTPYEESIKVPLHIRGPGIEPGSYDELALNIDLAPTFAQWGEAELLTQPDGKPLFQSPRDSFLIEHFRNPTLSDASPVPAYSAIRTRDEMYAEYETGEEEYYQLSSDPSELDGSGDASQELKDRLGVLKGCSGDSCK